jgi:hypothetical protein
MSVTKQKFQEERTAAIQGKYLELKKQKMKRADALDQMSKEFQLSTSSLSSIISRSSYQKPLPKAVNQL